MSSRNKTGLASRKESRSKPVRSRSRSVKSQKNKATNKKNQLPGASSAVSMKEANNEIEAGSNSLAKIKGSKKDSRIKGKKFSLATAIP